MLPEIINYLFTLTYPGSDPSRFQPVFYIGSYQIIIPIFPPGQTINLIGRPLHGVYAELNYMGGFGPDMVPNVFSATGSQYGSFIYSGILTQQMLQNPRYLFILVTDQEPTVGSVTNISSLAQRYEVYGEYIVIPTPEAMKTVTDALRRLHTSTKSEELLQQAVNLLDVLSSKPPGPRPPIGDRS